MSECKWTPGNLTASWNGYYYDIHAVDGDGRYIDQFCIGVARGQEANAILISASKDMYEVLASIDFDDGAIAEALGSDMQDKIIAALAKARGETK